MIEALKDIGISAIYTTNKPKIVNFENGEYLCKESYNIDINKFKDIVTFYENIGFVQRYKEDSLEKLIDLKSPKVTSIVDNGLQKVYDFSEPELHWGVVEGIVGTLTV